MKLFSQILISLVLLTTSGLSAQEWLTDFSIAKEKAVATQRPILLVFQGSDWCIPCMKMEREIWSTETFKNFAKNNYILLKADFPKRKQNALSDELQNHNNQLAETYNKNGYFPYVAILDTNGKKIGATGYKKQTPEEFIEYLNAIIK